MRPKSRLAPEKASAYNLGNSHVAICIANQRLSDVGEVKGREVWRELMISVSQQTIME